MLEENWEKIPTFFLIQKGLMEKQIFDERYCFNLYTPIGWKHNAVWNKWQSFNVSLTDCKVDFDRRSLLLSSRGQIVNEVEV